MSARQTKGLDFVIIGAYKSGTTSLYHYFRAHPAIYMPVVKELSFFSREDEWQKGTRWYLDEWYGEADPGQLWGEASPQHMSSDDVAGRIHQAFPGAKLIATLRNPIDRVHSHYKHSRRLGLTSASLEEYIARTLTSTGERREGDEGLIREFTPILAFGEYGRILANYRRHFAADRMRVIFFEDWKRDPRPTVESLWAWLEAKGRVDPAVFARAYNRSGEKRYPGLENRLRRALAWADRTPWIKRPVSRVVPRQRIRALWVWFQTELNVKQVAEPPLDPESRRILAGYYRDDVRRLEKLLGREAPWPEFCASIRGTERQ